MIWSSGTSGFVWRREASASGSGEVGRTLLDGRGDALEGGRRSLCGGEADGIGKELSWAVRREPPKANVKNFGAIKLPALINMGPRPSSDAFPSSFMRL